MKNKRSKLGVVGWILLIIATSLAIVYWYVAVPLFVAALGIWLYLRHSRSKLATVGQTPHEVGSEQPAHTRSVSPSAVQPKQKLGDAIAKATQAANPTNSQLSYQAAPVVHKIRRSLHDFIVFDIETTGLNAELNEIIQLSAIKVIDDKIVGTFDSYIRPHRPIPKKLVYLTGITNEAIADSPDVSEVMPKFVNFVKGLPLVGHNIVKFDIPFILNNDFTSDKIEALDTWTMAKSLDFPEELPNLKLPTLKKYFGVDRPSHNAIADCETNMIVYQRMRDNRLEPTPLPTPEPTHELDHLRFAITGEFLGYSRDDLINMISQHGGRVTKSVSKATDYLLDGAQVDSRLTAG